MNKDIKVRLSKIQRYEDFKYIKTHVEMSYKHEEADKFWVCKMHFMIEESGKTVLQIEKESFDKAKKIMEEAIKSIDG